MKPLLAHKFSDAIKKLTYPCWIQPKLNGVRALWSPNAGFWSRDEIQWHSNKLRHLEDELQSIFASDHVILDGELYVHGWSLQQINSAVSVNSLHPTDRTFQVEYHVFDAVNPTVAFPNRVHEIQQRIWAAGVKVKVVPHKYCYAPDQADMYYRQFVMDGYEGMMYRLGDCPYSKPKQQDPETGRYLSDQNNRSWHLIKRKEWQDDEFVVVGVVEGRVGKGGKYVNSLGAFVLALPNGMTFRAAPAMTDAERLLFFNNPPIGKKATVRYLVLSDDGVPLNPRVLTIRENV